MRKKVLMILGIFLVALGLASIALVPLLPNELYYKVYSPLFIVSGAVSLIAMAMMIYGGEKCPACGKETDAFIGRLNDPETKVCADCYIGDGNKKEESER